MNFDKLLLSGWHGNLRKFPWFKHIQNPSFELWMVNSSFFDISLLKLYMKPFYLNGLTNHSFLPASLLRLHFEGKKEAIRVMWNEASMLQIFSWISEEYHRNWRCNVNCSDEESKICSHFNKYLIIILK